MVSLTSTSNFIFLIAQKRTYPYSAQAKGLPLASSYHPPTPPHDMVWGNYSTTFNHRHIYTYNIYKFICLTAMNMKYLLRTSYDGCLQIYNDIQQVHTGYRREVHIFYITKSWIIYQNNQKYAYIF